MSKQELTDEEFEKLIEEQRHEEIIEAINSLVNIVKNIDVADLKVTIKKLSNKLDDVTKPQVNVDLDDLITAVNNLQTVIKSTKTEENSDAEWVFDIQRNDDGYIESVKAKKSA